MSLSLTPAPALGCLVAPDGGYWTPARGWARVCDGCCTVVTTGYLGDARHDGWRCERCVVVEEAA